VLFPTPENATAQVTVGPLPVIANGGELEPTQAAGMRIDCVLDRCAHDPASIETNPGDNFAAGMAASIEIIEGEGISFGGGAEKLLTDGKLGVSKIGMAASSAPYTPGKLLAGRFSVDFGKPTELNTLVAHHGTFNGSGIIYPPTEMTIQYWDGEKWLDVANAETNREPDTASSTCFDMVTTNRISVRVERPEGGRLAMRELQAYQVTDEERERVAALRAERALSTWTDYFLISHEGPGKRNYGNFLFDGELALIRCDAEGKVVQASVKSGSVLGQGDQLILSAPNPVDYLTARWDGDTVSIECPSSEGLQLLARDARKVLHNGKPVATSYKDGVLTIASGAKTAGPKITVAALKLEPPQEGLHGAQPWATVTWKTNAPASTQVEFSADDGLVRRTPLDTQLVTDHEARVEFLRPDKEYQFNAISVDASGRRTKSIVK